MHIIQRTLTYAEIRSEACAWTRACTVAQSGDGVCRVQEGNVVSCPHRRGVGRAAGLDQKEDQKGSMRCARSSPPFQDLSAASKSIPTVATGGNRVGRRGECGVVSFPSLLAPNFVLPEGLVHFVPKIDHRDKGSHVSAQSCHHSKLARVSA